MKHICFTVAEAIILAAGPVVLICSYLHVSDELENTREELRKVQEVNAQLREEACDRALNGTDYEGVLPLPPFDMISIEESTTTATR